MQKQIHFDPSKTNEDGSPYDLDHSNAILRKNFNMEIVMIDSKKATPDPHVYNLKYKVKKFNKEKNKQLLEFVTTN